MVISLSYNESKTQIIYMSIYKTSTAGILNFTEQKMMTKTQFVATMIIITIKKKTCNVSLSVNHNNGRHVFSTPSKLC